MQNTLGSGGHLAVSLKEIFSIVGRDWGLGCKHASAIFIMWTTPSTAPRAEHLRFGPGLNQNKQPK